MNILKFIFLLLASIQALTFGATISKLGCKFVNHEYDTSNILETSPVYGEIVDPLPLSSEEELNTLVQKITDIKDNFVENFVFNSVDNLIEFIQNTRDSGKRFKDFYSTYKPRFQENADITGFSVKILDEMVTKLKDTWSSIAQHVFLSAAQVNTQLEMEHIKDILNSKHNEYMKDKISDVYSTLKFSLRNETGYIFVGGSYVIVVRAGTSFEAFERHKLKKAGPLNVKYGIFPDNQNYIFGIGLPFLGDKKSPILQSVIYVGEAFCSIVDTTQKLNLLDSNRRIGKIYLSNMYSKGFEIELVYFNGTDIQATVLVRTKDSLSSKSYAIPLSTFRNKSLSRKDQSEIAAACSNLHLEAEYVINKIEQLAIIENNNEKIVHTLLWMGDVIFKKPDFSKEKTISSVFPFGTETKSRKDAEMEYLKWEFGA